jgi:hypothetical protein
MPVTETGAPTAGAYVTASPPSAANAARSIRGDELRERHAAYASSEYVNETSMLVAVVIALRRSC